MPPRRRIEPQAGLAALRQAAGVDLAPGSDTATPPRAVLAAAVRFSLEELASRLPGASLEVRVPPFGAVQCLEGPRHTRGTPPGVVEVEPATWLALVTGRMGWAQALEAGTIHASGVRADLSPYLPLF